MEDNELFASSVYVRYFCPNKNKHYKKSVSLSMGVESERGRDGEWEDYNYSCCYVNCACGQMHKIIVM